MGHFRAKSFFVCVCLISFSVWGKRVLRRLVPLVQNYTEDNVCGGGGGGERKN